MSKVVTKGICSSDWYRQVTAIQIYVYDQHMYYINRQNLTGLTFKVDKVPFNKVKLVGSWVGR